MSFESKTGLHCAPIQDVAIPDLSPRKRTFSEAIPAKEKDNDVFAF